MNDEAVNTAPETGEEDQSLADVLRAYQDQTGAAPGAEDDQPAGTRQFTSAQEVYADLGGRTEIAAMLGVKKRRLQAWIERQEETHCPTEVRRLSCGRVYSLSDWLNWHRVWKATRGSENWWVNNVPPPKPSRHRGQHRRHDG